MQHFESTKNLEIYTFSKNLPTTFFFVHLLSCNKIIILMMRVCELHKKFKSIMIQKINLYHAIWWRVDGIEQGRRMTRRIEFNFLSVGFLLMGFFFFFFIVCRTFQVNELFFSSNKRFIWRSQAIEERIGSLAMLADGAEDKKKTRNRQASSKVLFVILQEFDALRSL